MFKKLVAIGVFFVLAPIAFGQQGNIQKQLSLKDCINIALQRNTTVLQAQYSAEGQEAKILSAYGALLPSLSGTGSYAYRKDLSPVGYQIVNGVPVPFSGGLQIYNTYSAGVSANYTLFDGFANYEGVSQARTSSEAAGLTFKRSKQTAVYQTTADYLGVFNARDQLKIAENNLKRDQQQLETIKEENSVGSASLADVYQQQATVSGDEYSLIQAKNNYDQLAASLKAFLGIPVTDSVEFVDPTIITQIDTTQFPTINEKYSHIAQLMGKALEARPDYESAVQTVSASKSQLAIADAQYSPTVSLSAGYGISGPEGSQINQSKTLSAGVLVSIPIFDQFQTQTNIQLAKVSLKSNQEALENTRRQVQLDVYQALLSLYSSEKQYEAGVNQVASAKINLETEREKYSIGSATLLDVLTANALYTQALSNRVYAAYNYIQAKQQVEYAIGTINY